jgi:hypothetical protein
LGGNFIGNLRFWPGKGCAGISPRGSIVGRASSKIGAAPANLQALQSRRMVIVRLRKRVDPSMNRCRPFLHCPEGLFVHFGTIIKTMDADALYHSNTSSSNIFLTSVSSILRSASDRRRGGHYGLNISNAGVNSMSN